jgi:hypothetical protein
MATHIAGPSCRPVVAGARLEASPVTVQASSAAVIERYVFIKLKAGYATERGRAELEARSLRLARVPGVRGLTIASPADRAALGAWDLGLVVRFDALDAVEKYLEHPEHVAYYAEFLEPRLQVIKAWNFQVPSDPQVV